MMSFQLLFIVVAWTNLIHEGLCVTQRSNKVKEEQDNIEAFLKFSKLLETEKDGDEDSASGSGESSINDGNFHDIHAKFLLLREGLLQSLAKSNDAGESKDNKLQRNDTSSLLKNETAIKLNSNSSLNAHKEHKNHSSLGAGDDLKDERKKLSLVRFKYKTHYPSSNNLFDSDNKGNKGETSSNISSASVKITPTVSYSPLQTYKSNTTNLRVANITYQPTNGGSSKHDVIKYKHHKRNKSNKKSMNEDIKPSKQVRKKSYKIKSEDKLETDRNSSKETDAKDTNLTEKHTSGKNYSMNQNHTLNDKPKKIPSTKTKEVKNITSVEIIQSKNLTSNHKNETKGKEKKFEESNEEIETKRKSQDDVTNSLRDSLSNLRFKNGAPGKVKAGQEFAYISQCGLYTEPQNVSFVQHSWVTKTYSPYFYLYEKPKKYEKCKPSAWMNGTDMRGSVFLSFEVKSLHGSTMENNAKICEKYCCKEPRCAAWVLRLQSEATSNCPANSYCCWLKTDIPKPEPHEDCVSGIVHRDHYKHPPTGMRSSVPLGALGTGSFELRADGTFHEWTIENQSPGGSAKLSKTSLEMMLLGVRVHKGKSKPKSAVIRTHAPHGFNSVESLTYSGSYPVSKLKVELHKSLKEDIDLTLYAYATFHPREPRDSATPAVAFSLAVTNPSSDEMDISFMLNLPFGYNDDTIRRGNNFAEIAFTRLVTAADCQNACAKKPKCMAWTTNGPFSCMLKDGMPLHAYEYGIISGLKGEWSVQELMLNCKRPGFYPQSGDISMYPLKRGSEVTSYAVADDPETIWNAFKKTGYVSNTTPSVNNTGLNGAVSTSTKLKAGESKLLTIILSWYFPNKGIAEERVGNFYNNLFKNSVQVAKHFEKDLKNAVDDVVSWQATIMPSKSVRSTKKESKEKKDKSMRSTCNLTIAGVNTLPDCLQDIMVNSLSSMRSGMWMENGRWRQWEAFDCANMDPVHVDFHRIIPYVIFYPEIAKQVMLAWADHQLENGMIQESLSMGCLEETSKEGVAGGRLMADVNVGFIVQAYLMYRWTNDSTFFDEIYPFAVRAMDWLVTESTKGTGLPYRKPDTYDLFELEKYDHCAYNSILYLLALNTMKEMSKLQKDKATLSNINSALDRAEKQFDVEMWDDKKGFYHAWFDDEWGSPSWLMSDVFYGQVWAYTLGIGDLVEKEKIKKHLNKEGIRNDSPFGLKAISKSESPISTEDTSVILGDELNSCKSLENITKTESIWMCSSTDWSILQLYMDLEPHLALEQASKSLDNYRSKLRDQWNIHGLTSSEHYGLDGLPWATSHYTFQLVLWHLPLALSGQQYYAPNGTLTFSPKYEPPYWLPFYTPYCMGNIEAKELNTDSRTEILYRFKVSSGTCNLHELSISDSNYSKSQITINEGETVEWSTPKKTRKDIVKAILEQLKHR